MINRLFCLLTACLLLAIPAHANPAKLGELETASLKLATLQCPPDLSDKACEIYSNTVTGLTETVNKLHGEMQKSLTQGKTVKQHDVEAIDFALDVHTAMATLFKPSSEAGQALITLLDRSMQLADLSCAGAGVSEAACPQFESFKNQKLDIAAGAIREMLRLAAQGNLAKPLEQVLIASDLVSDFLKRYPTS